MSLLSTYQDEQLLQLLKENNELAFTEIYYRYWDRLFAVALQFRYTLNTYLATAVKYEVLNRFATKPGGNAIINIYHNTVRKGH